MALLLLLLFSFFFHRPTLGQSSRGYFINPPNAGPAEDYSADAVWEIGTVQTLRWSTILNTYNITLIQQLKPPVFIKRANSPVYCKDLGTRVFPN
jgi:hypothetical protein